MQSFLQDLRYGVRMLMKQPGFTLIAVLTLALGIGATTAIFSVVNAVLLKPLSYEQADRLVFLTERGETFGEMSIAYPNYMDWRAQQTVFENIGVYNGGSFTLTGSGDPEQLRGANASADVFAALKIKPALGRLYAADDDKPGAPLVAVLTHGLWQRRFGGDTNIINRTIMLNERNYTVIGVLSADFYFPQRVEIWVPLAPLTVQRNFQQRDNHPGLNGVARLKSGVTLEQARAEMQTISARLAQEYPASNKGNSAVVRPLKEEVVSNVARALWIILAAVGCVLLIACANVANLLLARAATRQREIAVRVALGASRWRIARQLLTESVILALLGGLPGLLLAQWVVDLLLKASPDVLPRTGEINTDVRVLGFTFVVTTATGLLFGLAPAWQAGRTEANLALKDAGRGIAGGKARFRNGLVIAEVAITLILLIGAGLLLRSFSQLLRTDAGFSYDNLLTFAVALPEQKYGPLEPQMIFYSENTPTACCGVAESQTWDSKGSAAPFGQGRGQYPDREAIFYQKLQQRLRALPGVTNAAWSSGLPFGNNGWQSNFMIEGQPPPAPNELPSMEMTLASPGYFETMKIPLRAGRWFDERDNRDHVRGRDLSQLEPTARLLAGLNSIVIDEEFARRHWPGASVDTAVGKRVRLGAGADDPMLTVLGVVGRVKMNGLREETNRVQAYLPYLQGSVPQVLVTMRTTVDPNSLLNSVLAQIRELDPQQPISQVNTMEQLRAETIAPDRLNVLLLGSFAALALVLALIGLYGVISYAVTQRTSELGLRVALGAQPRDVLRLVLGQGMRLAGLGIAIGIIAALVLTRLMTSLLFAVNPYDPLTFGGVALLLAIVALLACWIPARRAIKVDPMVALRCE